jgi:hypothetical protein
MGLAAIFSRFTLEAYDPDVSDTVIVYDHFIPNVKLDSKGVRLKVWSRAAIVGNISYLLIGQP